LSRGDPDRISPVSIGQPRPRTTQWKAERTGRFLGAIGGVAGGRVGVGGRGANRENIGWGRRRRSASSALWCCGGGGRPKETGGRK